MRFTFGEILKCNYQTATTNRFVVDSPRFWRKEYHPRFKDLFNETDFIDILKMVNNHLSFKFDDIFINILGNNLFQYFSGYRFANIPEKNPESPKQFASALFFVLLDILGQISFKDFPLEKDDFNNVTQTAETGKNDTTKLGIAENFKTDNKNTSELNYTGEANLSNNATSTVETVDNSTDQNTKTVNDVFLSPQNQGVKPTTKNEKGKGSDGLAMADGANFTTSVNNQNIGDSTIQKTNTLGGIEELNNETNERQEIKTGAESSGEMGENQDVELTAQKNDVYTESLENNKSQKLQDFYTLYSGRLWIEILDRLSTWVLQMDIATAEQKYTDCKIYK